VERQAAEGRTADAATDSAGVASAEDGGLDIEAALAHVNGDRRLLREIARLFLADSPRTMATLRRAVRAGDAAGTRAAAHALKGAVAIFGARETVARARDLQRMGETGDLSAASSALLAFESHMAALGRDLAALTPSQAKSRARPRRRVTRARVSRARKTPTRKR
jgi:HPt (histidine-containing phosphotransfer) domain-containing protein